jgi:hypothetical protein
MQQSNGLQQRRCCGPIRLLYHTAAGALQLQQQQAGHHPLFHLQHLGCHSLVLGQSAPKAALTVMMNPQVRTAAAYAPAVCKPVCSSLSSLIHRATQRCIGFGKLLCLLLAVVAESLELRILEALAGVYPRTLNGAQLAKLCGHFKLKSKVRSCCCAAAVASLHHAAAALIVLPLACCFHHSKMACCLLILSMVMPSMVSATCYASTEIARLYSEMYSAVITAQSHSCNFAGLYG